MAKGEAKFGVGGYTHGVQITPELAEEFLRRLASGESAKAICESVDENGNRRMPEPRTWRLRARNDPEFGKLYKDAMEDGCWALQDENLEIADDGRNDWMQRFDKDGNSLGWVLNGEHVQRSKLRTYVRDQICARRRPDIFGQSVTLRGDKDNPVVTKRDGLSDAELEAIALSGRKNADG